MTLWQAGMRITAARLNDATADETTTSGLVPAAGYTTLFFQGRKSRGTVYIGVLLTKNSGTVAAAANTENITPEPTVGTLPAGWRPPESQGVAWDNGTVNGQLVINTDGTVVLRTISYNQSVADGTNIRLNASWVT